MSITQNNSKYLPRTLIIATFFLTFFCINVSAQDKTFSDEELTKLRNIATEKLKDKSYRTVTTSVNYVGKDSILNSINKKTFETVPPDRRHVLYEKTTAKGVELDEWIYIGDDIYRRENNGDWQIIQPGGTGSGSGIGTGSGSGVKPVITYEYKIMEGQIVNQQKSDLYQKITTWTYTSDYLNYQRFYKQNYWFNEAGLFAKFESESSSSNSETVYRTTIDYTYDANIKIEAPVIKKDDKSY